MTNNLMTTGGYTTGGGYYDPWGTWVPYSVPYWNPPVYIQPVVVPPQNVIFYPDEGLKEEVKELKKEIVRLRKALEKK